MQLSTAYKQRLVKAARIGTAAAMVVSSVGAAVTQPAFAALNVVHTDLTSSQPSTSTTYTTHFKVDSGKTTSIVQATLEFCTTAGSPSDTCTAASTTGIASGNVTTSGFANGTPTVTNTSNAVTLAFTGSTAEVAATDHVVTITGVTTPGTPGTYYTKIKTYSDAGTTLIDSGEAAWAIVNPVSVTGRVLENMSFAVNAETGVVNCSPDSSGPAVTGSNANTTAVLVPFGNLVAGTPNVNCQSVATTTNAASGFTTNVHLVAATTGTTQATVGYMCRQTATNCNSSGAADAVLAAGDYIADNGFPGAWVNGTTKGLGVNANGSESVTDFNAPTAKNFKSMGGIAGVQVAGKSSPSNGVKTYVSYKIDVPGTQTAGVYQTKFEYITTPTF